MTYLLAANLSHKRLSKRYHKGHPSLSFDTCFFTFPATEPPGYDLYMSMAVKGRRPLCYTDQRIVFQRRPKSRSTTLPSTFQPIEEIGCEIRHHDRRARPEDALGALESHGLEVKDPGLRSRVDHRKLAADLVRGDGHVPADLLRIADDVEV